MNRDQTAGQSHQNQGGQQQQGNPSRRPGQDQQDGGTRNPDEHDHPGNRVEKNEQLDKDGSPGGANG